MAPNADRRDEAAELSHRSAKLRLPSWLWGGDVSGVTEPTEWKLGPSTDEPGVWNVQLQERYSKKRPRHLEAVRMGHAGNVATSGAFSSLRGLPVQDEFVDLDYDRIAWLLDRASERYRGGASSLYLSSMATSASPQAQLPEVVRQILCGHLMPELQHAEAWLIRHSSAVSYRLTLCRLLMMHEDDPASLPRSGKDFRGFASARGLLTDITIGLSAYLAPAFLSESPSMWGYGAQRVGGVVVYLFGEPISVRLEVPVEPIQVLHGRDAERSRRERVNPPRAYGAALRWWTTQLNEVFTEITDPCNFVDETGFFVPQRQLQSALSIEQVFRNLQSISVLDRDPHARRIITLDVLDTLEGLKISDFKQMCTLSFAQQCLEDLKQLLPDTVGPVLLPRAESAVAALRKLQEGFFLASRLTGKGLRVPDKSHGERELSLEDATAAWIRVLRNAGHGFGSGLRDKARDEVLLLAHDAEVPSTLSDVAYLYVLRLLSQPALLRRTRPPRARRHRPEGPPSIESSHPAATSR